MKLKQQESYLHKALISKCEDDCVSFNPMLNAETYFWMEELMTMTDAESWKQTVTASSEDAESESGGKSHLLLILFPGRGLFLVAISLRAGTPKKFKAFFAVRFLPRSGPRCCRNPKRLELTLSIRARL